MFDVKKSGWVHRSGGSPSTTQPASDGCRRSRAATTTAKRLQVDQLCKGLQLL